MKIVVDCRMIGSGGIGSYVSEILPHLLEKNNCLLLGTHAQCMDFVRSQNAEFCFCDTKPFSFSELRSLPRSVNEKIHQYDLFFSPYCNIPGNIHIPIVSTIHDVVFLDFQGLVGFWGKCARKWFYERAIKKSERIVTVSEFSRERIKETLKCRKRIMVTPNGIPSYLLRSKSREDEEIGERNEILFVGNVKKHKGLTILLDAFKTAVESGFSGKLVIVGNADNFRTGDEEAAKKIRLLSETGATSGKIEFTGRISNEKLRSLYVRALVLVQPSLYEGFGIPPLESLCVGTPALISDIPVFREVYEKLPVQFFSAGNSSDLAQKLISSDFSRLSEKEIALAREKYSYKKSAEILSNSFKDILGVDE